MASDRSGLKRFRSLDPDEIRRAIDKIFDAHLAVAAGSPPIGLDDGSFLDDVESRRCT